MKYLKYIAAMAIIVSLASTAMAQQAIDPASSEPPRVGMDKKEKSLKKPETLRNTIYLDPFKRCKLLIGLKNGRFFVNALFPNPEYRYEISVDSNFEVEMAIRFCAARNCGDSREAQAVSWLPEINRNEFRFRVIIDRDTALYNIRYFKDPPVALSLQEIRGSEFLDLDFVRELPDNSICLLLNEKKVELIPDILEKMKPVAAQTILENGFYFTRTDIAEIVPRTLKRRNRAPIKYNELNGTALVALKIIDGDPRSALAFLREYLDKAGIEYNKDYLCGYLAEKPVR